ncbi:hypothetical protein BH11PAT4_BH11PAT4_6200 [soil metagenome]
MKVLERVKHVPFHTFLLAAFPVLFLFAQNQSELQLPVVVTPIAIVWLVSFTALSVFAFATRNWLRAALCVSFMLAIFFTYPHLYGVFGHGRIELGAFVLTTSRLFNTIGLFISIAGLLFLLRTKVDLIAATKVINVVATILLVMGLTNALTHKATGVSGERLRRVDDGVESLTAVAEKPDIYYIIFDRYANKASLDAYGYDNAPFLSALEDRGARITQDALGNYPNTTESLASSLNMKYLNNLADRVGKESSSVTPLRTSIEDNMVSLFLREQDYTFYNVGSWWEGTRKNSFATKNYIAEERSLGLDEFATNLFLNDTPLGKLDARFFPAAYAGHAERFEAQLSSLREIAAKSETTYTFSHILMPHDPYVFNADCSYRDSAVVEASTYQENYLQQLTCLNTKILSLVDDILASSDKKPLIVMQSDEGPHPILSPKTGSNWLGYPDETYQEKLRIFSAVIAPDDFSLTTSTTPVNTFREVFNHYFGAKFPILENRSFVFEREERPYLFVDVTDKVAFPSKP